MQAHQRNKSLVAALITLGIITGCATSPVEPLSPQPSIVIDDTVVDTSVLLAEQAYASHNRLYIQFRHLSDTINSYAILTAPGETSAPGSSSNLYVQQAVEQYNELPLAQLSYLDAEQWIEHTHELQALPVAGVALWREFRDRLFAGITPRKPGTGIVVEFLKQEEMFFYYDDRGLLRSIPVHHKPGRVEYP